MKFLRASVRKCTLETVSIRVFILAENRLLREALALLLGKKSGICVVDARAFSPQMVAPVAGASPDLLLVDSSALNLRICRCFPKFVPPFQASKSL